jgi:hypothetical protein
VETAAQQTACLRCGRPGRAGTGNPEARLLRRLSSGYCADCAVTEFLLGVDSLREMMELRGPEVLREPHVQVQFTRILVSGTADAVPSDINWERVVANWGLPFSRRRRP